jgi:hypothetical protein
VAATAVAGGATVAGGAAAGWKKEIEKRGAVLVEREGTGDF